MSATPPAEDKRDERPVVGTPLDGANDAFHEAYDRARQAERVEVPVLVVLADEIVLYRHGARESHATTPRNFHIIKSAAHVPVAVFAALYREDARAALTRLREHIVLSRGSLPEENAADAEVVRALRPVLERSLAFVDQTLASRDDPSEGALGSFARDTGPLLLGLTELATRIELAALDEVVERILRPLDHDERKRLQVVVTGNHQARARSLGMQYFQKRLREPQGDEEGAEERVAYAEGVDDADEAHLLVGTRRTDAKIAKAFFGDSKRLQRDVLGDAVSDLLSRTELPPIA